MEQKRVLVPNRSRTAVFRCKRHNFWENGSKGASVLVPRTERASAASLITLPHLMGDNSGAESNYCAIQMGVVKREKGFSFILSAMYIAHIYIYTKCHINIYIVLSIIGNPCVRIWVCLCSCVYVCVYTDKLEIIRCKERFHFKE